MRHPMSAGGRKFQRARRGGAITATLRPGKSFLHRTEGGPKGNGVGRSLQLTASVTDMRRNSVNAQFPSRSSSIVRLPSVENVNDPCSTFERASSSPLSFFSRQNSRERASERGADAEPGIHRSWHYGRRSRSRSRVAAGRVLCLNFSHPPPSSLLLFPSRSPLPSSPTSLEAIWIVCEVYGRSDRVIFQFSCWLWQAQQRRRWSCRAREVTLPSATVLICHLEKNNIKRVGVVTEPSSSLLSVL